MKMEKFNVLIVEDHLDSAEDIRDLIVAADSRDLSGSLRQEIECRIAATQEEAEAAILHSPAGGFDLILLDLHYPERKGGPEIEYRGMQWLPALRKAQPDAAVVILTAHAEEMGLETAVTAVRDHHADEFIPKHVKWLEILRRLNVAIKNAQDRRQLRLLSVPGQSRVSIPVAEDITSAINYRRQAIFKLTEDIESGAESKIRSAPAGIREEYDKLRTEVMRSVRVLAGNAKAPHPVNCGELVRDFSAMYTSQLQRIGALIEADPGDSHCVTTYGEDLRVALHEVMQNAVDALAESKTPEGKRRVWIGVTRNSDVIFTVRDNGDGFTPEALNARFQQGATFRKKADDRHRGMGLYVARRMMTTLGGDIDVTNAPEGGAIATLIVTDLKRT